MPYPNFIETARCLDVRRLGKQRIEAAQILRTLGIEGVLLSPPQPKPLDKKQAWANHPAVRMWVGYEGCLKYYYNKVCQEWVRRGYQQNMGFFDIEPLEIIWPSWLGNEDFHSRHRASLLYKNYEWYSQFGWTETPKIDYLWPR